jgi:quercetin dioxygenase-like cupin family protein
MVVDQFLKPHRATVDILIIAATGSLEIGEGEAKHLLKAGEHIMFAKDVQHSVLALTDASFYLIKLAPHEQ